MQEAKTPNVYYTRTNSYIQLVLEKGVVSSLVPLVFFHTGRKAWYNGKRNRKQGGR